MSFVLDASVAIAWAFSDADAILARPALEAVQAGFAVVPSLWHYEIASALGRSLLDSRLTSSQVSSYLADLGTLDIRPEAAAPSLSELLVLARRFRLTTYDAAYLDLAARTSYTLATLDRSLARAAREAGVALFLTT